jgi:alkylated DNA repair protein alkB family protein 4
MSSDASWMKTCACTGVRWCAACRDGERRARWKLRDPVGAPGFLSERAVATGTLPDGSRVHLFDDRTQAAPGCPEFSGLVVWRDFVTEAEAARLLDEIESRLFVPAQSGKAKQHFGPRMNFRKRRMNPRGFEGLPRFARDLERRVRARAAEEPEPAGLSAALEAYVTTDAFVLRYESARASNLDLHVDDTFAYGELILALSLESDGWLTFLDADPQCGVDRPFACVRARLPARSMALLFGPARYHWLHGIRALDIEGRRTSITLRTLGSPLRSTEEGREVMARADRVVAPG